MTELIFLGVGAIVPETAGDHVSLLIRHGDATLLLDAGPAIEVLLDRAGVNPTDISHVYFSHQHGDHTLGSPMLLFHPRRRTFVAAAPVLTAWRQLMETVYPGYLALIPDQVDYHKLFAGRSTPWPDLPDVTARIAQVDHSGIPAYALRLDFAATTGKNARPTFSLVYSGDTRPTNSLVDLARGANLLIHEATSSEQLGQVGGPMHTTARQAGELAQRAGVGTLALVHRLAGSREAWQQEAAEHFGGQILVPQAGDKLQLPNDLFAKLVTA